MNTLSLAMIVKNEEEVLDRCLSSISDIVNEIIIVDTGSTDKTKEIANKYNVEVFDFEWIDDFSAARNFSFSKCTCDFILWLDADDVVKEADKLKIKELMKKEITCNSFLCRYIYAHDEKDNPILVLKRNRILRNKTAKWYDPIHEYLVFDGYQEEADINVHHYQTEKGYNRKQGRNLKILNTLCKDSNLPRHQWYYARELADAGQEKKAEILLKKFIKAKKGWEGDIINAYQKLASIYYSHQNFEKTKKLCLEAIEFNPNFIEIYNVLSKIYYDQKNWNRVIRWCEIAKTIKKPDAMHSYHPKEYDFTPYDRLCYAYYQIGDYNRSYENNELALKYGPTGNDLSRCLFNKRHLEEILSNIEKRNQKDGTGISLNIGCGTKKIPGYIDTDVVKTPFTDEVFSMTKIPYKDSSVEKIYCEHALEHLSHSESNQALDEMSRVLKPGGELLLFIPDLEKCCKNYSDDTLSTINGFPSKEWYKYTIFGIQRDENGVPADFQFHKTGFCRDEIMAKLESKGFVIDYCESY